MIFLTKFAESRGVKPDTVTTYIRRHPEEFAGHTEQQGNKLLIDEYAERILDEKYPLPSPVEVIEDKESREKLIKAQELIIQIKDRYDELKDRVLDLEREKLLIEMKTTERIDAAVKDAEDKQALQLRNQHREELERWKAHYNEEIQTLKAELEAERNKTWIQKLFRR